ncbi:TPA: hypothetical protein EYP66_00960 [Candidatus Poribacteria bacterium]|nr:hypothetical protein [Candidatus Poribacteria bacterium]
MWGAGGPSNYITLGPSTTDLPLEEKRWYTARIENQGKLHRMFVDNELLAELETGLPENSLPSGARLRIDVYPVNIVDKIDN